MKMLRRCFQNPAGLRLLSNILINKPKINHAFRISVSEFHCQRSSLNNYDQESSITKVQNNSNPTALAEGSKDVIFETLRNTDNLETVLKLTESHHSIMNNKHLSLVYRKIFYISKNSSFEIDTNNLETNSSFKKLCNATLKRVRFFDCEEILSIFKVLVVLKVPQDSAVFQAICQMLRHYINDLNLQQITFLDLVFPKKEGPGTISPLVEAIKMALPVVLKSKLENHIDSNDLFVIIQAWAMARKYNIKSRNVQKLYNIILMKSDQLNQQQILILFFNLAQIRYKEEENYKELSNVTMQFMCNFILDLNWKTTNSILTYLSKSGNPTMKNEKFLTLLSHKAVRENWDLWQLAQLANLFMQYEFVSMELLDLLGKRMLENPELVSEDPRVSILTLTEAFSLADYMPNDSNKILDSVTNSVTKIKTLENRAPELLVKLVTHLVILKAATENLLQIVLNPEFVDLTLRNYNKGREMNILQCYRVLDTAARLEFKNYQGPFLDSTLLKRSVKQRFEHVKTIDVALKNFLEVGLGGSQFMLSGLWTHFGHFIDHLVVMRKGDYPVAIGPNLIEPQDIDGIKYVEDLSIPPDAKVLAILVARQEWFTKNPFRQTGWATFHQRTLDQLGYNPVILGPPMITKGQCQDITGHLENGDF